MHRQSLEQLEVGSGLDGVLQTKPKLLLRFSVLQEELPRVYKVASRLGHREPVRVDNGVSHANSRE